VIESILSYGWDILTMDYKLRKKLLSTNMDFWIRAARTSTLLQVRNEVPHRKYEVNTDNFARTGKGF
jgi:hypothetical protein